MNPMELFKHRLLIEKPENEIVRRCQLANNSRRIIQQLNSEQQTLLKESLQKEVIKWKNCFKWREWSPNTTGPRFESDNFALPKSIPGVEEPKWVTTRREFLKCLPPTERNIILTGDPDLEFDPYTYIWIYSYPELAVQNPIIEQNFQHILQFEENFEQEPELPPDHQVQIKRTRPQSSKNRPGTWKKYSSP